MHPLIASMWLKAYDEELRDAARHARIVAALPRGDTLRARAGQGLIRLGHRVAGESARLPRAA